MKRKDILLSSVKMSLLAYINSALLYELARITNALNIYVVKQDKYANILYVNAISDYIEHDSNNLVKVLQIIESYV